MNKDFLTQPMNTRSLLPMQKPNESADQIPQSKYWDRLFKIYKNGNRFKQ
jgi:hypothetical protein